MFTPVNTSKSEKKSENLNIDNTGFQTPTASGKRLKRFRSQHRFKSAFKSSTSNGSSEKGY